ncbi:MAG: NADAR family protein [Gemmataceae bacterium]
MLELEELRRRCREGEPFRYLYFWGHQPSKDGRITAACLSQWFPAIFKIDEVTYPTAEHWMMASKARLFGDEGTLQKILATEDPKAAKAMGRLVKNFDDGIWKQHARRLVTEGNAAKFGQNQSLREYLVGTGDQVLVEASPYDDLWGIGLKATDERAKNPATWNGLNWLGFALMDVRTQLS